MTTTPTTDATLDRPRRILACDGGGIRGVLSLGVLERIEALFRQRRGKPELVLADAFDFFAGTSTGAIIATALSWGMPVAEVLDLYRRNGDKMFQRARGLRVIRAKYKARAIAEMFKAVFTEDGKPATLGSARLRTLLMIVLRNASTGAPWPLTNNPLAVFNDRDRPDCNLALPLWRLLRGSTAAPLFFPPEDIRLGGGQRFTFMDGGVTAYNNPALIAALTATLPEYRVNWPIGPDRLQVISVGTGFARVTLKTKPIERLNLFDHVRYAPQSLISSASVQQDTLCRILGVCKKGNQIDAELGKLQGSGPIPPGQRWFTYLRYDPALPEAIPMDNTAYIDRLLDLGRGYAEKNVQLDHLVV